MTLELDETACAISVSLARLDATSPLDIETMLAVRDMSRGYFDRQLIQPARILPAVQPRIDPDILVAIGPLFQRARELVSQWRIGKIGGHRLSAEEETAAVLYGLERDREAPTHASTSIHESLIAWLRTHKPGSHAFAFWREEWIAGQSFSGLKKPWLLGFLADMDEDGLIGQTVLDVGAGRVAVSDSLALGPRKVVQVDSVAEGTKDHVLLVQLDMEAVVSREGALAGMRAYTETDTFDTLIYSHILNYVDFRATIEALHRIHAPGGRVVIFNQPFEGEAYLFSPRGARDNVELLQFLTGEGYAVEYLQAAPWVHVDDYNPGLRAKSLLIVARNRP
jgi:hypothetical protein